MSLSAGTVPRLDKDHALADVARDFIDSDAIDRIRREDLDVAPEEVLQVKAQAVEVVVRGTVCRTRRENRCRSLRSGRRARTSRTGRFA